MAAATHGLELIVKALWNSQPLQHAPDAGLIKRAANGDQIAEFLIGPFAIAYEQVRRLFILPAAFGGKPSRRGHVVEHDKRFDTEFLAGRQYAAVVVHFRCGKFPLLRLNARPLQGEAIAIEPELRHEADVILKAVILIASVPGRFLVNGGLDVLGQPRVAADVIAFDLMPTGGTAPQESFGKFRRVLALTGNGRGRRRVDQTGAPRARAVRRAPLGG